MRIEQRFLRSPEAADRTLMVVCAVVWLLVLGFFVAAGVALTDLGRGHPQSATEQGSTPWLLYTVIGVSALVIAAAIPLLLRARRGDWTQKGPAQGTGGAAAPLARSAAGPAATRAAAAPSPQGSASMTPAAMDRLWLRGGLGVLTVMGLAMVAVAIATHLMAVDSLTAAWVVYGVAAVLAIAMVAVPLYLLRELRAALESGG